MDELYLADFKQELKILWRGVHSERERFFRDEEGIVRKGTVRQWKADRPVRQWAGNPGWNACVEKSRGQGGKSEAVREELRTLVPLFSGGSCPKVWVFDKGGGWTAASFADRLPIHTQLASAHTRQKQKNNMKRRSD